MNRVKDEGEPFLRPTIQGNYKPGDSDECSIKVQEGKVVLNVAGKAPNGKDLLNATLNWPNGVMLLPQVVLNTSEFPNKAVLVGLVDGYCSAPIRPEDLWDGYNYFSQHPDAWFEGYSKYFEGGEQPPNWLFYGYYVPPPIYHRAFDIWAVPGTPVYAPVPGKVVRGDFDHIIAIQGPFGKLDLNHIVPTVNYGDIVKAGQLVGYIAENQGNHVHMEFRPDGQRILYCFPGFGPEQLIRNPRQGPVPVLPYLGEGD
ncbi:MAG: M23 family metallopeptidase [Candidatus Kryptoniota bacterium]